MFTLTADLYRRGLRIEARKLLERPLDDPLVPGLGLNSGQAEELLDRLSDEQVGRMFFPLPGEDP